MGALGADERIVSVDLSATDLCALDELEDCGFGFFAKVLEALPRSLTKLVMPRALGSVCYAGWGIGLGPVLGRMQGHIEELRIEGAVTGSSDVAPQFVEWLTTAWLPMLPHLRRLLLPDCCLHSAETLHSCSVNGSLVGEGENNRNRCQFAALASAAPQLEFLDLRGNLLSRHDDRSTFVPPSEDNACGELRRRQASGTEVMEALAGCLRSLPCLLHLRLGIADCETDGSKAWSAEQIAVVKSSLPPGCTLDQKETTHYAMVLDGNRCGRWREVPLQLG